ncbi:MAG: hypothetical protein NTU41_07200 [Chloroflexi bacterium]|nr:hypothetical protein [Chloroflexota bacterium]
MPADSGRCKPADRLSVPAFSESVDPAVLASLVRFGWATPCRYRSREDLIAGVHMAVASRVGVMAKRLEVKPELAFTGRVAKNIGMKKTLCRVITCHD